MRNLLNSVLRCNFNATHMMGIILLLWMERPSLIRSTIDISAENKPSDGGDDALVLIIVFISIKPQTLHGVGERRRVVLFWYTRIDHKSDPISNFTTG